MFTEKEVLIVANGEELCSEKIIKSFKYIIAADGGYDKLPKELVPKIVIGDFDSTDEKRIPSFIKKEKFPIKKDFIDLELAINYAIDQGFKNIYTTGVSGSRKDHFFASLLLISKFEKFNIHILTKDEDIFLIKPNTEYTFFNMKGKRVSFFSITEKSEKIVSDGFEYEYQKNDLFNNHPSLGVSNKIIKKTAKFKYKKGKILCFLEV
ncbi:MAG: thiamine diphosphokinase [candidate division WOR-3 bacterium]